MVIDSLSATFTSESTVLKAIPESLIWRIYQRIFTGLFYGTGDRINYVYSKGPRL